MQDKKRRYTRRVIQKQEEHFSVGQLSQAVGVSRTAIYKMIANGDLEAEFKIGNRHQYTLKGWNKAKQRARLRLIEEAQILRASLEIQPIKTKGMNV